MNNEHCREKVVNENIQTVTALRNSWVVCKSKSHPGRIYYFNTLTGEAAWNLSDAEIEKANKRTKILQSQPGANLECCPEPEGPPTDIELTTQKGHVQSHIICPTSLNKQNMKKCYHDHFQNSLYNNTKCLNFTSHNVSDPQYVPMAAPSTFNPNIWTIPPNHHIVIAPTTPVIGQSQTSLGLAYNDLQHESVQKDSLLQMKRFNIPFNHKRSSRNFRFNRGFNKYTQSRNFININHQHINNSHFLNTVGDPSITADDLRQKLAAKRSYLQNNINKSESQDNGNYTFPSSCQRSSYEPKIQIIKPTVKELCPIDADDSWLKEHAYVEGTQLKLNVSSLKAIVMIDGLDCWYIVADSNTLLDHFTLINIIVNSDEQCQLMVPDDTMAELQMKSRSDNIQLMSRTHSVLQHLSQQFTSGGAVIGKDSTNESKNIIDFTTKLAEQNHNVILLLNHIETQEDKCDKSIPILTIQEMKELLERKPMDRIQPEMSRVKITIPNNVVSEKSCDSVTLQKHIADKEKEMDIGKNTLDMGVQTEFENEADKNEVMPTVDIAKKSLDNNSNKTHLNVNSDSHNFGSNSKTVNNIVKKREIRLKRNTSQQLLNVAENKIERKQFKWRRRKNTALGTPKEINQPTTKVAIPTVDKQNPSPVFSDDEPPNDISYYDRMNEVNQIIGDLYDGNYSDTTSGPCFGYNDINKNTIIDETSTSGVISNTASNVDSESIHSITQNVSKNFNYEYDQESKCVMFEVENSVMEECLQMRIDEWLSIFVQIMEDILTQILRLNPPFHHSSLPPPWTLHEATECIKKKFNADGDIKNAANKLTDFLYRNSNDKGVINAQLKPSSFMEMYSYGVYLVDSLQAVINNCEDLQTAAESLARLLTDIQNADSGGIPNDSSNDNIEDPSANVTVCSSANSTEKDSVSTSNITKSNVNMSNDESDENIEKSGNGYNLRSNQKNTREKTESPRSVKFVRNIDIESTFFSCLNLQRKRRNNICQSPDKCAGEVEKITNDLVVTNENTTEPKIIRQFNKCLEYEERLRNKQREVLNLDSLDYSEGEQEYGYYDEEFPNYDYYASGDSENLAEIDINQESEGQFVDKDFINDSKWILSKTVKELRQTLLQVYAFCNNTREELTNSQPLCPDRRLKIQELADNARVHLSNLFEALKSIVNREDEKCGTTTISIFNGADIALDSRQDTEYRTVIGKCMEQADILLESVNIVLEAVTSE